MSFSAPFAFTEIGSDGAPIIDATLFREIMEVYGWNIRRRRIPITKDCPCYDPNAKVANPDCPFCEGTGNISGYEDEIIRGLLLFNLPNGVWSLGQLNTIVGELERTECSGYFPPESDVRIGDIIILVTSPPNASEEQWHEMKVYNNSPRIVGDGSGHYVHVYSRCDMRHVEYPTTEEFTP